jgi:limonene-1,2-epoxide hydrolase
VERVVDDEEANEMTNVNVIEQWVERFNSRDVVGCAALYADEASLHIAFVEPVQGRAAIQAMFDGYFSAAPMHCIVKHLYAAEGGHVVLEWQDKVGLLGVNIYEVADGLIQRQRNYFDQITFLRLNGLPMPPT